MSARKTAGIFILTFFLLAALSLIGIFYSFPFLKAIHILLCINALILLSFFFRKSKNKKLSQALHKLVVPVFSFLLIIFLLIMLIDQFYKLAFNFNYILFAVFILGLFAALTYRTAENAEETKKIGESKEKEEEEENRNQKEKVKADWLIYPMAVIASALISFFVFSKLEHYGFLNYSAYLISAVSFIILAFVFIFAASFAIKKKIEKEYILVFFLALAGGTLVFFKIKELDWLAYLISGMIVALIFLISCLILKEK